MSYIIIRGFWWNGSLRSLVIFLYRGREKKWLVLKRQMTCYDQQLLRKTLAKQLESKHTSVNKYVLLDDLGQNWVIHIAAHQVCKNCLKKYCSQHVKVCFLEDILLWSLLEESVHLSCPNHLVVAAVTYTCRGSGSSSNRELRSGGWREVHQPCTW